MSVAVTTRVEQPADIATIRAVEEAAFGRPLEASIVDGVRGTADWLDTGSIVAFDENGRICGHVMLSRGRLVGEDGIARRDIGMIGPVAVLPDVQRQGVGKVLMSAAISAAEGYGFAAACLLGHPTYYPRFGFEPARALGLEPPEDWPDAAWMALRLPGWTPALRGVVHFPPAFSAAS